MRRFATVLLLLVAALGLAVPTAYGGWVVGAMLLAWGRHLAVLLVALTVLALGRRHFRLAAFAATSALAAGGPWALLSVASVEAVSGKTRCARVVSINAFERNRAPADDVARALASSEADVVLFVEPRPGLVPTLQKSLGAYRVVVEHLEDYKFDLAIFVRAKTATVAAKVHRYDVGRSVVGEVVIRCPTGPVRLFAVHIPAPTTLEQQEERWWFKETRTFTSTMPTIVAGDFNAVPPDPVLRDIARNANLSRLTTGATWPLHIGGRDLSLVSRRFGLPLDHVLVRKVAVGEVEPFVLPGSDHLGYRFTVFDPS